MSGKAIGTNLPIGFRGAVTRTPDTIIAPYTNKGTDDIQFGDVVVFHNGGVRKIKSGDTADMIIGIAVRHIAQPYANDADGWYYKPNEAVDVLLRGSIAVQLTATAGIAARGKLYVATGSQSGEAAGNLYCATGTGRVQVPNTIIATANFDADKIVEVTILTRAM